LLPHTLKDFAAVLAVVRKTLCPHHGKRFFDEFIEQFRLSRRCEPILSGRLWSC